MRRFPRKTFTGSDSLRCDYDVEFFYQYIDWWLPFIIARWLS